MELQLSRRRGAVDALTEADEVDPERGQFLRQRDKMLQ